MRKTERPKANYDPADLRAALDIDAAPIATAPMPPRPRINPAALPRWNMKPVATHIRREVPEQRWNGEQPYRGHIERRGDPPRRRNGAEALETRER